MKENTTKYRLLSYFLVVFSLAILLILTKDYFFELQALRDQKVTLENELETKKSEHKTLTALKGEKVDGVDKYTKTLNENELVDYIYGVVESVNTSNGRGPVAVKQLSIGEPKENDLGFMESLIELEVQVGSEAKMETLLDTLVAKDASYQFFIDSFSYEVPESQSENGKNVSQSYAVTIPLRFFYK